MPISLLPRRTVLQSGALVVPLALAGLSPRSDQGAAGASAPLEQPLSGVLAAWVVVDPDHGATVRLVQLDAESQPSRQVAAYDLTLSEAGVSLDQLCRRAHELALNAVAGCWGVPACECSMEPGQIAHPGRGQAVGYTLWVDMA